MYIEASDGKPGDTAFLESKPLDVYPNDRCISFMYHMYGDRMGTLSVSVRSNGQEKLLWSLNGEQLDRWLKGEFNISPDTPQNATVRLSYFT